MALSLLHSDPALRARLSPQDDVVAALVFELLEQIRVEALADPVMMGVRLNLRNRHEAWAQALVASGLTETERGMLVYTVDQVCRSRVTGEPLSAETQDFIEGTRFELVPLIGTDLAGLRENRGDQTAYAVHAEGIAREVSRLLGPPGRADGAEEEDARGGGGFNLLVGFQGEGDEAPSSAPSARSEVLEAAAGIYRVFTTEYDQVQAAAPLVREAELSGYREQLDRSVRALGISVPRLARQLGLLLAHPTPGGWDDAQEEGRIDGRRLARLVSSPTDHRSSRTSARTPDQTPS